MTTKIEPDDMVGTEGGGPNSLAAGERHIRLQLAACYRIFARRGMDDLIFTHLSARLPGGNNRFLFIPFGMLFEEVTASNLLEVNIEGNTVVDGASVNPAGWIVHRVVYEAVPEAQSVMHLHTVTGTAVSAQKQGLLPVNQFGITFFGKVAYHDYDGPGLRPEEQKKFIANLSDKRMMFLRNHGTLTHGRSIAEAFILMHNLERTCEISDCSAVRRSRAGAATERHHRKDGQDRAGGWRPAFRRSWFQCILASLDRVDSSDRA